MLRIAVCGAGPVAHSIAAVCAARGFLVRVLAKNASRWRRRIAGKLPDGSQFTGEIERISPSAKIALAGADVVLVCLPYAAIDETLRELAPHVTSAMLVGAVPGFGGFGIGVRDRLPQVRCFFGLQRIPFVVRSCRAGRNVEISGIRRQTFVGTLPAARARPVAELLAQVLGVRTVPVSHYLNIELSPSNSIVNAARLYALFGPKATRRPRREQEFFLDWNLSATRVLLEMDWELQEARWRMPRDTSFVAPLLAQYDANDARTLTDRIRQLSPLAGRRIPARRSAAGAALSPRCAYLREDIDHGLRLVRDMLRLAGAPTPTMDQILEWRLSLLSPRTRQAWQRRGSAVQKFATIGQLARALD